MKSKHLFPFTPAILPALLTATLALSTGASAIGVVIDGATGNGGFVNATSGVNTLAITGWTGSTNFWIDSGNTPLASVPFGTDTIANSHVIQLHNDAGCVFTSTTKFNLAEGDGVKVSFDYKTAGTGGDTTLTVSLVDTDTGAVFATLGSLSSTADAQAAFVQKDFAALGLAAESNLALRLTLSDPAALGKDFHIDRVHLETVAGVSSNSYWDINGAVAGAGGAAPAGNWSGTNWSTSATGEVVASSWIPGNTAIFAAGTDATDPYLVTLAGAESAATVRVQEGSVELTGGSLTLAPAGMLQAEGSSALTISSGLAAGDFSTAGNIHLNGANTVTGNLQIISSTLTLGSDLSVGDLGGAGNLNLNGRAFATGAAGDTVYSGLLSGAGTLTKQGTGRLQLTNILNSFPGNVVVGNGILETGAASGAGVVSYLGAVSTGRTLTVNPGGTLRYRVANVFGGVGKSAAVLPALVVNGGTLETLRFNILGDVSLSNGGSLTNNSTETAVTYGGFQFLGDVSVAGSGVGTFIRNTTGTRQNHLKGLATTTFAVADITGSPAADLTVSSVLGNGSGDYAGVAALVKSGPGTMDLTAANTYTGSTTVTGGILAVHGSSIVDSTSLILDGGRIEASGTEVVTALYFGGVQQSAGTWGASGSGAAHVDDARFTGIAGVINVTTGPASETYDGWIAGFPGAASAPGFKEDADGDGIPNGAEHLLGTDPTVRSSGVALISTTGGTVTFRHTQTNALSFDVTKAYEWSTDLAEWKTSGVANSQGTIATLAPTTITESAAPANDLIEVVATLSGTPSSKLFLRVAAVR